MRTDCVLCRSTIETANRRLVPTAHLLPILEEVVAELCLGHCRHILCSTLTLALSTLYEEAGEAKIDEGGFN